MSRAPLDSDDWSTFALARGACYTGSIFSLDWVDLLRQAGFAGETRPFTQDPGSGNATQRATSWNLQNVWQ